jgi:hypothetical protein
MAQEVEGSIVITSLPLRHRLKEEMVVGSFVRLSESREK